MVRTFNDPTQGERPVERSADALFAPSSVAWRVHGDVAGMMVGGVASLLLQMLHPGVLAGVWDHSDFRRDPAGRLRRTARFIALTTYGRRDQAEAIIAKVRGIHDHVHGRLPDGTPYSANDSDLLAWVHVTETLSFLDGWRRYGEPRMSRADQDRYFAEMAAIGTAMGADPVPRDRTAAESVIAGMRPALRVDDRTRSIARAVLARPADRLRDAPVRALLRAAAIDQLPGWAKAMHGFDAAMPHRPLVRAGTWGIASTLRWAFA
ncbi:oxygenase MpaB family protein [Sphingomonas sp. 1P06PA]|uniref:oxygenase MpaB family protein n=1 Tax=Sphingomonas sp. 1P06PA TaxID=554121 RepID=UPI0039A64079